MGKAFFDKDVFRDYKERLMAQKNEPIYKARIFAIDRIMHEAEQCGDLSQEEYEKLCDIASGKE